MSTTKWVHLRFDAKGEDGKLTKDHFVPASLKSALLRDLKTRGCSTNPKVLPVSKTSMDQPGMVHTQRPWKEFSIPGLRLALPCEDVQSYLLRIQGLEVRRFDNGNEYYKLHSWISCIVLRPFHKVALAAQFVDARPSAEAEALAFYSDKKPSGEVLREAHAKVSGIPLEQVPKLANDRQPNDRFFPKKDRGQA